MHINLGESHTFDPQMHVGALVTASFVLLQIGWQLVEFVEALARVDFPVSQFLQPDCPVCSLYFPVPHGIQLDCACWSLYVPVLHDGQLEALTVL